MRPGRKLRNLNVWQQGIVRHRAARHRASLRRGGASGAGAAHGGWARAFFRRLLGRRATAAREGEPAVQGSKAAGEQVPSAASPQGLARPELREGMLSRRAIAMPGQSSSPPRIARADTFNVAVCRDVRFWQRGSEFVAAARGGFDTGAGPEHVLQRRAYWRQRSLRQSAAGRGATSKATQSLRLLFRALAARQVRDDDGQPRLGPASAAAAAAGAVNVGGRSRKTANKKTLQPVAAAAGTRRTKSFRDHQFRQQGLNLLEKTLRAKKQP